MSVPFNPPTLWSADDIGEYLDISTKTVLNDYIHRPGFPAPIGGARRYRKWVAEDVVRFLVGKRAA